MSVMGALKEDKKGRSYENFLNYLDLEVTKHLYDIKNTLHQADKDFFQLFPVILTDNGGEFARVDDIEMDVRGESKLFFYDPNGSDQKSRIEKNHTLIRDILPKGTSFDNLTQKDINLVCSHVNSVKCAALNGKSDYELFAFTYGEEIPKLLGISKTPAEYICQSSTLLQHKTPFKRLTLTSTIAELNLKRFQMRGFCALFFSIPFGYKSNEIKH